MRPSLLVRRSAVALVGLAALLALAPRSSAAQPVDSTAQLLQQLIRVNSSNPPGKTQGIADLLGPMFRARGFEVTVIPTPDSGKVHFFARLNGNGSKKPVLIAAHVDVVGVEPEKWSLDPFAGIIKDGYVYGRGAIDFKGGAAVFARAAMLLADRKVPLDRDVIFLAEADEEGQPLNTTWLSKDHWNLMDAEFALNEGGWIIQRDDKSVQYVSISTEDKQSVMMTLTAKGTSTHSSMPLADNALITVGRALAKLTGYDLPLQFTAESRQYFEALARTTTGETAQLYRDLLNGAPDAQARADKELSKDALLHSLMRGTIAPVIMNAGFRSNVIPGSAEAQINLRIIPGTDPAQLQATFEKLFNDPLLTVRVTGRTGASNPSPQDNELYKALAAEAKVQWPQAAVTPYLFQAGTDAGAWRSRNVPVYGIYPYPITNDELRRMHGNDERVAISSLAQGTEMIYRTLVRVAATPTKGKPTGKKGK